jgi:hypothetical protein
VEQKRYFRVRGRTVLVYDTLSPFITLAAIELDTKYECGYSPKIILDRQFDRLYARANRVVGQALINRTSPWPSGPSPAEGSASATSKEGIVAACSFAKAEQQNKIPTSTSVTVISRARRVNQIPPWKGDVAQRQGDVREKKGQTTRKKLTDSDVNPHQSTPPASNKNDLCNKTDYRTGYTSAASVKSVKSEVQTNRNTQITSKKLTDSDVNPHQSTPPASNKNDVCNKTEGVKRVRSQAVPADHTVIIHGSALATQALRKIAARSGRIENVPQNETDDR